MTHLNLTEGNNYFRNEKYKESIGMYSKIHKSSNYYQEDQYYLAECYLNKKEFIEAVEAYNKVHKNYCLFEKASSNISVIEKNFDLINIELF